MTKHTIIKIRLVLFSLLLLCTVKITAQNTTKETFDVQELKSDVEFFFSELEKTHPNLYYYYPKDSVLYAKETIIRQLTAPMSLFDITQLIRINTNRLFDGHTGIKWYNLPKSAFLFPPKQIRVERGIMYIGEGTETCKINSINGKSASEIINTMRNLVEAGKPIYIKDCTIEDDFPIFFFLLYGSCEKFSLAIEQNGKKSQIALQGVTTKDVYYGTNEPKFDLIIKNGIALLTVNTFNGDFFEEFQTFLDSSFKQIKQADINNLFIDVSENSGGSDNNVSLLLDYIYPDDYYFLYGYALDKDSIVEGSEWLRNHEVESPYLGKVYVLQSYKTFSAAMDFASAIKTSDRGIIIGEMTSDPAYSFSNATGFRLPNTGIWVSCAQGFYAMPSGSHNCNVGILPDVYCHRRDLDVLKKNTNTLFEYFESMLKKYGDRQNSIEILKLFE